MSNLNHAQQKTLVIIPHITGALSILGSGSILYDIWKERTHKLRMPYYRILLGMSIFDFISSISFSLSTLPMPQTSLYARNVYGVMGTEQTCTAQGFFNQFMLGGVLYNFMLSIYYALVGIYKIKDEEFTKRYEVCMHMVVVAITVGSALGKTMSLPMHLFGMPMRL